MSFTLALENIASGEIIDFSKQSASEEGIGAEATSGATGFGLPSVDVKWADGAGDGSRYRGTRVLPRDLDLNLDFIATDEADLQAQMAQLARVLSSECILWTRNSAGKRRWVRVVRTGGGDFATGMDTNGENELSLSVTLRAGQPFWVSETGSDFRVAGGEIGTTLAVDNEGSANARPVWRVTGPTNGFTIGLNDSDERLIFTEFVDSGLTITVDTAKGTVVDSQGRNRYSGLGPSPRFFPIPPGLHSVNISMDRSSDQFLARLGGGRVNFVTNPRLQVNADGWDLTDMTRDSATRKISNTPTYQAASGALAIYQAITDEAAANKAGCVAHAASLTISGLTVGQTYQVWLNIGWPYPFAPNNPIGTPTAPVAHAGYTNLSGVALANLWGKLVLVNGSSVKDAINSGSKFNMPGSSLVSLDPSTGVSLGQTTGLPPREVTAGFQFVAQAETVTLLARGTRTAVIDRAKTSAGTVYKWLRGVIHRPFVMTKVYVGEPGVYFDGATTDTPEINYVWAGAADASISQAVPMSLDTSGSSVLCQLNPRDWMVV